MIIELNLTPHEIKNYAEYALGIMTFVLLARMLYFGEVNKNDDVSCWAFFISFGVLCFFMLSLMHYSGRADPYPFTQYFRGFFSGIGLVILFFTLKHSPPVLKLIFFPSTTKKDA